MQTTYKLLKQARQQETQFLREKIQALDDDDFKLFLAKLTDLWDNEPGLADNKLSEISFIAQNIVAIDVAERNFYIA